MIVFVQDKYTVIINKMQNNLTLYGQNIFKGPMKCNFMYLQISMLLDSFNNMWSLFFSVILFKFENKKSCLSLTPEGIVLLRCNKTRTLSRKTVVTSATLIRNQLARQCKALTSSLRRPYIHAIFVLTACRTACKHAFRFLRVLPEAVSTRHSWLWQTLDDVYTRRCFSESEGTRFDAPGQKALPSVNEFTLLWIFA